ncbi:MAG: hypothetical protein E6876_04250 [Clostridium sp.]|nr:hypothetical protein [Clostridium sp.]
MFKNVINKASRNLNVVKVDGNDLENLGLYLKRDYELTYSQVNEVELKYIPGRDMPYHKFIRKLPIEFEIEFNIKGSSDFYKRIDYIRSFFNNSKDKLITFNKEDKGFKLYHVTIGEIKRAVGDSKLKISFMCYPDIYYIES